MPETPRPQQVSTCPKCGGPLPFGSAVEGCPRCRPLAPSATSPSPASPTTAPAAGPRTAAPSLAELAPHFPELELLELLGQGGMGAVYRARQRHLDRFVALKILRNDPAPRPGFVERFTREARALARINHPGIVGIHDFGRAGPYAYLILEYVDGANLRQTLENKPATASQALSWVIQICEALQFAHDRGVVHRDIKPGNILIDRYGRVKIADFGLAKLLDPATPDPALTAEHHVMGTPNYMAPEQVTRPLAVDHRADIYSLGVVFYEMLTGNLPVGHFPRPSQKVRIDVRLDEVVLRSLEQEPERRYQQARELRSDVESIHPREPAPGAGSPTSAPGPVPRPTPFTQPWWASCPPQRLRTARTVLLLVYAAGLAAFFAFRASFDTEKVYREVGFPRAWLRWERPLLGERRGPELSLHFPSAPWTLLALAGLAYLARTYVVRSTREWRWNETVPHYAAWTALSSAAAAFVLAPRFPSATAVIRELPSNTAHVANGLRTCHYAVETPSDHRLRLRLECRKDGRRVAVPGLDLDQTFTPARGQPIRGRLDLLFELQPRPRGQRTNGIDWQWQFRASNLSAGHHDIADDPFLGLPLTDSSYGHRRVHTFRPNTDLTLLVVRGDRERLLSDAWDLHPAVPADVELHLTVRTEPTPEPERRETPHSEPVITDPSSTPDR